jgi:ABC-type multidrug transport system fused ATPase/permease subunit
MNATSTEKDPNPLRNKLLRLILRPYRWWIAGALAFNILVGMAITFQNIIPKYILDNALLTPGIEAGEKFRRVLLFAVLFVVIGIIPRALSWHASFRLFGKVREACLLELRTIFFRRVNHLCISFHNRHNSGELFSYLFGTPLAQVQQYYQQMAMSLPNCAITVLTTLAFVSTWDIYLTGVMLLCIVAYSYVLRNAMKQMRTVHHQYQEVEKKVSGRVADLLRGHQAIKIHAVEEKAVEGFMEEVEIIRGKSYYRDMSGHLQHVKEESTMYAGFAALSIVAAWRYLGGHITVGQLTATLTAFLALYGPLGTVFQVALMRSGAMASLDRICRLLETASSTPDPVGEPHQIPGQAEIQFDRVSFSYEQDPTLTEITLAIPYGQNVALVGSSGAGKSTLIQLLLRLYDPDQGKICIGGVNLRHCSGQNLRRRFGVVPQDPYIFNTTVRKNLLIVNPSASDQQLQEACERANAWEFINKMPQGLDTPIGEGGATMSGGQRQRLAIARALLLHPDFYVFDEATSALDTLSEQLIKEAMSRVTQGKTAFFIAHRLASIEHCDRILVLDKGRIVQDDTYRELANKPGLFQNLLQGQLLGGKTNPKSLHII